LVNTTINVSADKRRRKYKLLEVIKDIVYKSGFRFRVTSCMEMMNSRQVDIIQGEGGAFYRGVMACGSVWLCPVCASRITEGRRQELQQALSENTDLIPVMITATLQHEKGDRLFSLMDVLNASLRKMKAGRWWKSLVGEYGIVAHVSSLEITYSQAHGWHPHKHMLLFVNKDPDIQALKGAIIEKYTALVAGNGRYASEFHSIDVTRGDDAVASYIQKWSLVEEIMKANVKDGRHESYSPFQLAELAGSGEAWAEKAFIEYAQATYRKKQITWSHKSRKALGLGKDKSDQELAEAVAGDVVLCSLSRDQWKKVLKYAMQAEVLEQAEKGGADAVMRFLSGISPPDTS